MERTRRPNGYRDREHGGQRSGPAASPGKRTLTEQLPPPAEVADIVAPDPGTPNQPGAVASAPKQRAASIQNVFGLQLFGGGDVYEQHADAVADRICAGESAEALLSAG